MPPLPIALRDGLRALRRAPLFAAMAVVSLGLALALNTTMFALADATLRPTVPFDADHVYRVWFRSGGARVEIPFHQRLDAVRAQARVFSHVSYAMSLRAPVQGGRLLPEDQWVFRVPPNFFETVGVRPEAGRIFAPDEADVAIVSHGAWRRMLGGASLATRPTIAVGSRIVTVIGVMPRGMHYPAPGSGFGGDVWLPAPSADRVASGPMQTQYELGIVVARARTGLPQDVVQGAADLAAARLVAASRIAGVQIGAQLLPGRGEPGRLSDLHRLLAVSVTVVLLIACANLATLMLARGVARRREVALRMAIGATRGHVMRAVLAESGVLAFAGAALGALLTLWALYVLGAFAVRSVPQLGDLAPVPSWRVFAFMLLAAIVAMVLCAALPAVRMAQADPAAALGDGSGNTTARTRERHGLLVVVQVALGMSLLLGAGWLVRETLRMRGYTGQFDARRLLVGSAWMLERNLPDSLADRFYANLEARTRSLPGVANAATFDNVAPQGALVTSEQGRAGERWLNLQHYRAVSPPYLATLGIPIVAGRDFQPGDRTGTGAVIVDEEVARRLWPDVRTPVGRMLKLGSHQSRAPWVRVVGVSQRIDEGARTVNGIPSPPAIYHVAPRSTARNRSLLVRAERRGDVALPIAVRRVMEEASAGKSYPTVRAYLAEYQSTMEFFGFLAMLFASFGAFALVLAAVGLYGVLGYMVSRRMREFAVRVALGARAGQVGGIVLRQAATLTLAGVGVGAIVALLALFRFLDFVFQAPWTMAIVLLACEALVFGVAALASLGPVRRAARADPLDVMRAT